MAKLTSSILKAVAPRTAPTLRDRFLPFLNEALPRYGIVNEVQVAAFLATAAFESMYFQKTKEGKAGPNTTAWRKYQSKYWATNYMGRGIFQTTSKPNYRTFGQKMKAKGLVGDSEIFVNQPELLEQPKWAVESACEFWVTNGLDVYARQGFKGFAALEGKVNRGRADRIALGEPDRLIIYKAARLALPDDFILDNSDSAATPTPAPVETQGEFSPDPIIPQAGESDVPPAQTEVAAQVAAAQDHPDTDVPEKTKTGIVGKATAFITALFTGTLVVPDWITNGLTADTFTKVFNGIDRFKYVIVIFVIVVFAMRKYEATELNKKRMEINADPTKGNVNLEPDKQKLWWRFW